MNVLIIKHIENEGPGLIEYRLMQEKIPYQILDLETGVPFPRMNGLSHIIFLGGPMNVYANPNRRARKRCHLS
jgi:GMP synthase-like glutamine amidotransferase